MLWVMTTSHRPGKPNSAYSAGHVSAQPGVIFLASRKKLSEFFRIFDPEKNIPLKKRHVNRLGRYTKVPIFGAGLGSS